LLSRVHRSFLRLAVFTSLIVFGFWGFVYALDLSAGHENVSSQIALMRSHLLLGGGGENDAIDTQGVARASSTYTTVGRAPARIETDSPVSEKQLASRVSGLEQQIDETDYQDNKKFKEQYRALESQSDDLDSLKSVTAQLQQTATGLPDQISQAGSQADARAGQAIGEAAAAKQMAQGVEQQINTKLKELENRAVAASQDANKAEAQASGIRTRTEKLETEVLNLTKQLEERTAELKNSSTKENEEQLARLDRLQRVAFASILSEIRANVDEMERRVDSSFYRFFNKGEARRDVDALKQRISGLASELRDLKGDQAKQLLDQLEELRNRAEQISARVK
jgi:DNA repair exonuclease SbcCD ATPase subunit